jgi:glutathione synthase/RimK-type ligase-like ATP-grasp enzyme
VLGYGFRSLDAADGYLFEVSDGTRRAYFSAGAGSPYAFNRAHSNAIARDKAFAQTVLRESGLPTIPSRMFFTTSYRSEMRTPGREPEDARAYGRSAAYPIFCKPLSGAQGAFAEIIADAGEFERYLARLSQAHYAILVQPVIRAPEFRVFVIEGRALFCYQKLPASVTGDGAATLGALIHRTTAARRPDEPEPAVAETTRGVDGERRLYGVADIVPAGVAVAVEGAANRALGGRSLPPQTDIPAPMADLATLCAAALKLGLAAIDLFDCSEGGGGYLVIEVNANPAIKTLEDHGRWDLIEAIWTANFAAAFR